MQWGWRQLWRYAMPLIVLQWLSVLGSVMSTRFLAASGDIRALAASGLSYRYYLIILVAVGGCQMALGVWLTKVKAEHRQAAWRQVTYFSACGGVLCAGVMVLAPVILAHTGVQRALLILLRPYFWVMAIACVFLWLSGTWRQALIAFERPTVVYGLAVLYLGVHVAVSYVFILGRAGMSALGLTGVALAECVSLGVVSAVTLWLGRMYWRGVGSAGMSMQDSWRGLVLLWRQSWPVSGLYINEMLALMVCSVLIAHQGHLALAAYQVVSQCDLVFLMIPYGMSIAMGLLVAKQNQACFSGDSRAVKPLYRLFWRACLFCLLPLGVVSLCFWLHPRPVLQFFFPAIASKTGVFVFAKQFLTVVGIYQLFDGIRKVAIGWCRGLGVVRTPFWVSVCCFWGVGVAGSWFFVGYYGVMAIWWSIALAMICGALWMLMTVVGCYYRIKTRQSSVFLS